MWSVLVMSVIGSNQLLLIKISTEYTEMCNIEILL